MPSQNIAMADLLLNKDTNGTTSIEKEDIESPRFESVSNVFSASLTTSIDKELDSLVGSRDGHDGNSNNNHSTPKKRRVSETMVTDENRDPNVAIASIASGNSLSVSTPNRNSSSSKAESASRGNTPNRTPLRVRRSNNNTPISTGKSKKVGSTDFDIYDENDGNSHGNVEKNVRIHAVSMKNLEIDVDEATLVDEIPSEDLLSPKDVYPPEGEIAATGAKAAMDNKLNHQSLLNQIKLIEENLATMNVSGDNAERKILAASHLRRGILDPEPELIQVAHKEKENKDNKEKCTDEPLRGILKNPSIDKDRNHSNSSESALPEKTEEETTAGKETDHPPANNNKDDISLRALSHNRFREVMLKARVKGTRCFLKGLDKEYLQSSFIQRELQDYKTMSNSAQASSKDMHRIAQDIEGSSVLREEDRLLLSPVTMATYANGSVVAFDTATLPLLPLGVQGSHKRIEMSYNSDGTSTEVVTSRNVSVPLTELSLLQKKVGEWRNKYKKAISPEPISDNDKNIDDMGKVEEEEDVHSPDASIDQILEQLHQKEEGLKVVAGKLSEEEKEFI